MHSFKDFTEEIGARIRKRRKELRLSQGQVAGRANLSRGTISNVESGNHIALDTLVIVAHALEADILEFIPSSRAIDSIAQQTPSHAIDTAAKEFISKVTEKMGND